MRKLLVCVAVALALSAAADAAPPTWLALDPTVVAPGWTLRGSVVDAASYSPDIVVGLTLERPFRGSGEQHALRARGRRASISFDGRTGRWRANGQLGTVATIDMRIRVVGEPRPAGELLGCFAALRQVRVRLTGTLVVRTGTLFFGTIRRATLTGTVVYAGDSVVCEPKPPEVCTSSSLLRAGGANASLSATRHQLLVQFSEQARRAPAGVRWYHVAVVGHDALRGEPPALVVAAPPRGMIRGSVAFTGGDAEDVTGACPTTSYAGSASGTLRTTFAGWGARTLTLKGAEAIYRTTGSRP